jgi:uncharacterized protein with PIN domain
MVVLDAYALTALLADEPAAEEVGRLIAQHDAALTIPNLAEAADWLQRVHHIAVERTRSAVESLEQSTGISVRPAERPHAWRAARLRAQHYYRTRRPLSLGDCLLLALTEQGDRLATSDPHILRTAAAEGIASIALPDSRGRRHAVS